MSHDYLKPKAEIHDCNNCLHAIRMPTIHPCGECKNKDKWEPKENGKKVTRLTNREWIDFLVKQFDVSRTSAKEMLHGMMQMKKEDNFKKEFNHWKS